MIVKYIVPFESSVSIIARVSNIGYIYSDDNLADDLGVMNDGDIVTLELDLE